MVSAERLDALVGDYESDGLSLDLNVTHCSNVLWARATGQSAFPLTRQSDTEFVYNRADIKIVFKTINGEVSELKLHQRGQTFSFSRVNGG